MLVAKERVEECFDEFVASAAASVGHSVSQQRSPPTQVLRIWCQTLGPPLERNFFVELIQATARQADRQCLRRFVVSGTAFGRDFTIDRRGLHHGDIAAWLLAWLDHVVATENPQFSMVSGDPN